MKQSPPLEHVPPRLLSLDSSLWGAARQYGTPLYVYDLETIEESIRHLREALPRGCSLLYSLKANPNPALVKNFVRLGVGLEVCSSGELKVALGAGAEPGSVIVAGPGKHHDLLSLSIQSCVGFVVLESAGELRRSCELAERERLGFKALLRINPGQSGGGLLNMGGATQFGMDEETAAEIINVRRDYERVEIAGLHGYLGTGILEARNVINNTTRLLESFAKLQHDADWACEVVNVGGGFGIPYFAVDRSLNVSELAAGLEASVGSYLKSFPGQKIFFESGRFLVGPSGVFLTSVLDVKTVRDHVYVIVDGGTNCFDLGSQYLGMRSLPVRILGHEQSATTKAATICGPLCTPTDRLAAEVMIPQVEVGDVIAFFQAGAYGFTAARSLFLSHTSAAEALLERGETRLIRERFTGGGTGVDNEERKTAPPDEGAVETLI